MNPLLTDEAVAALPLETGRAALLEEILGTPTAAGSPAPARAARAHDRAHRRWLAAVVTAALVATLAFGSAWWAATLDTEADHPQPPAALAASPSVAADPQTGGYRAVLEADGWTLASAYQDPQTGTGEVGYHAGDATLSIDWYPASDYAQRYDSRRGLTDPPSDGRPVEVLGRLAHMWAYTGTDHTVLRPVEDGHFLEIRGTGLGEQAFTDVLSRLRLVDAAGFDASLPNGFVHHAERSPRVAALLDGIGQYAQPLLPPGVSRGSITTQQSDPVQVGSDVANQVACAWMARYVQARRTGDRTSAEQAVTVMKTSRKWPVLLQMQDVSDVPEWVWAVTDEMSAGHVPQGWRPSCRGYLPQ